jgi:hypothetical protein
MPNRTEHRKVGSIAGFAYSGYHGHSQPPAYQFTEAVGGAIGGYLGGSLPDVFEPAYSSWHRDFMHSWSIGASIVGIASKIEWWEQHCRQRASHYHSLRMSAEITPWSSFLYFLLELFWRLAAGFINGLFAGYVSHQAIDACTPRGLPLFAR